MRYATQSIMGTYASFLLYRDSIYDATVGLVLPNPSFP